MLLRISVRNFALIDEAELEFADGFTCLTGETGSGKSVLFSAVGILLGARASTDLIRRGADRAVVEGVLRVDGATGEKVGGMLDEAGVPFEGELIVRRELTRSGRNRAWINDHVVTVALLSRVTPECIDLLGQHEHLSLLQGGAQRELIDQYGVSGAARDKMAACWKAWRSAERERERLTTAREDRVERMEFLRFQLGELAQLELRSGEYDELESTVRRIRFADRLRRALETAAGALSGGDGSAGAQLDTARDAVVAIREHEDKVDSWLETIDGMIATCDDLSRDLAAGIGDVPDVDEIDNIVARHEQLRGAMRRFATDEEGLIERTDAIRTELQELENYEGSLGEANARAAATLEEARKAADVLRAERERASAELFLDVAEHLEVLGMGHATLALAPVAEESRTLRSHGWDDVAIHFSANPGEPLQPIERVASGGELSRLLLAIKRSLLARDPVDTYLFDEVDTGIGGEAARVVGRLLRQIGEERQVLCITHLPQIAGQAKHQFRIAKSVAGSKTTTTIEPLSDDDRVEEIARMLGGAQPGEETVAHARALLRGMT